MTWFVTFLVNLTSGIVSGTVVDSIGDLLRCLGALIPIVPVGPRRSASSVLKPACEGGIHWFYERNASDSPVAVPYLPWGCVVKHLKTVKVSIYWI